MSKSSSDIFDFTNPRDFLISVIRQKKARNPQLGLRHFSLKAGFKSPASLSLIVAGKRRFTPLAAEKVANALNLVGKKRKYFFALIQLESAKSSADIQAAKEHVLRIRLSSEAKSILLSQYHFLSQWYYPAIYALVETRLFREDSEWIAKRLGRGITPLQVTTAIHEMIALGLLSRDGKKLIQSSGSLKTSEDVRNTSIRKYHESMSGLAVQSLDIDLAEREINGLTVAIPSSQLTVVKEKIRAFRSELNQYLSQYSAEADEVFQLNLQFFPLTTPTSTPLSPEATIPSPEEKL